MKKAIQRIMNKDIKSIENLKNIYVKFNESNILEAYAIIIGPTDTLYENAILYFKINFPNNYPFHPPIVKYIPNNKIRIHPNLYICGKVCLSLLGTWSGPNWTSIMDISSILLSIQSLLNQNPLHHEPGYDKNYSVLNENYNSVIKYNSIESLYINNCLYIPNDFLIFKNEIVEHYNKTFENMIALTNKYISEPIINIKIQLYGINKTINYKELMDKLLKSRTLI